MKIAFLSNTYHKANRGGETFVGELSKTLGRLGHGVFIFENIWELWKADPQPDIVIPVINPLQTVLTKIWCFINNKKIIVTGQAGPGFGDRIRIMAFPDVFVALSDFQINWAKSRNPLVIRVKIPNGVDLDKFKPGKSKLPLNLKRPIILWVGALDHMKRPELVIQAVAKTRASLLLVGKGPREQELLELGNKLLPGRFEIKSFTFDQMPEVYRVADLFVFSTVPWESFGIVMLEAMATNLPVVVSDDPIRKEIVGDAGFIVDVTNTDLFAKKIKEALEKGWGDIPRERAKLFSWDNIAKQYDQLFCNLVRATKSTI